jgi:hypothetical protein
MHLSGCVLQRSYPCHRCSYEASYYPIVTSIQHERSSSYVEVPAVPASYPMVGGLWWHASHG